MFLHIFAVFLIDLLVWYVKVNKTILSINQRQFEKKNKNKKKKKKKKMYMVSMSTNFPEVPLRILRILKKKTKKTSLCRQC